MDVGEQVATEIFDAIRSDRDLWVFDEYIGSGNLERVHKVLVEKREGCSDPDRMAFLTSIIRALEKGDGGASPEV